MTCPFSKLGLSDVLWSAHFNSLLLLHLVLSLPLFWSEHCIQHCWHHPRLAWNATALSRGAPGSCSGAAVIEGQGDENTSAVWSSSCAGLYFRTERCSEKCSWVGKGKQPFHWAGSVIQNRKIKSHLPIFFSKLSQDSISSLNQVFSSWFFYLLCSASPWVQSKALWSHYKDCFVFNRLWIKAHMTLGKLFQINVMKCLEICKHTCPKY